MAQPVRESSVHPVYLMNLEQCYAAAYTKWTDRPRVHLWAAIV